MSTCISCARELRPEWKFCITCGTSVIPGAIRPESIQAPRVNLLAIVALVLACLGGPPALVFGHIAIAQIKSSGERGLLIALIATVLGYVWLAVTIAIVVGVMLGAQR